MHIQRTLYQSRHWAAVFAVMTGLIVACSGEGSSGQVTARDADAGTIMLIADQPPEVMNAALALQQVFRDVARSSVPTVVQIDTTRMVTSRRSGRSFEQPGGTGSGVIYDREGNYYYVLTNAHVIHNTDGIQLTLYDGTEIGDDVRLVGVDPNRDIAVLRFDSRQPLAVATLGDSDSLVVGDQVLAVGSPFGFQSTVTTGIISGVGREQGSSAWAEYIQTDAAINPGNSGGALVALDGSVIAINTWIASRTGGSDGIGFALPINTAVHSAAQIRDGGVHFGYLGILQITADEMGYAGDGALVFSVVERSPAARAGLQAGDVIVAIDGRLITGSGDLLRTVSEAGSGTWLVLKVRRDRAEREITVRLAERPDEQQSGVRDWPGIAVSAPTSGDGLLVRWVSQSSAAWLVGLRRGDVITRVDGRAVGEAAAFYGVVADADEVRITFIRGGRTLTITISQ